MKRKSQRFSPDTFAARLTPLLLVILILALLLTLLVVGFSMLGLTPGF